MPRSPRPPGAPIPAAAPGPSQQMAARPGGGQKEEDSEPEKEVEYETVADEGGFVFQRPRGVYLDVAPSSAQAAGPDPELARLRAESRRRRALLRIRAKRLSELAHWEALASSLRAPLPAPAPPPPQASSASPPPAAAAATSDSVLDDLLGKTEVQKEIIKRLSELCDEVQELCRAREAAIVDAIAALPVWGRPKELMKSFCNPEQQNEPGDLDFRKICTGQHNRSAGNGDLQRLDNRQGERATEAGGYSGCQEGAGASPAAVQRIENSGEAQKRACCETPAELGDELPPHILVKNRKRKAVASPSGSNSAAAQTRDRSKRKKASGNNTSTPSSTQLTKSRTGNKKDNSFYSNNSFNHFVIQEKASKTKCGS